MKRKKETPEVQPRSPARRRLLIGAGALGTLAIGGGALFWPRHNGDVEAADDYAWRFLLPADRVALRAVAPNFLGSTLWQGANEASAREFAIGVDTVISHQLPRTRDELRQLFDLFASPGGRFVLLGSYAAWNDFPQAALADGVNRLRDADLAMVRTAYEGLREVIYAVWYADPAHWATISYSGPSEI